LESVDMENGRPMRGRQSRGLFVGQRTANGSVRDLENLISYDQAEALAGCHGNTVEEIFARDLQDMFDRPEGVSLGTLYGGSDLKSKVRNLALVVVHGYSVLSDLDLTVHAT
jgi:hypothetical protein